MKNHDDPHSADPVTPNDDWLNRALVDSTHDYLMDDGFAARVTQALPSQRVVAWRRPVIIGIGALAGCVITAITAGPELLNLWQEADQFVSQLAPSVSYQPKFQFSTIVVLLASGFISWLCWRKATR